jgi:hypothetical protein
VRRADLAAQTDPAAPPAQDEGGLSWRGLKSLFLDRRLLVFVFCIVLFFIASAALLPGVAARVTRRYPEFATLIVAGTMLLPQAIVAAVSPWIGSRAQRSGRRPLLLFGWGSGRALRDASGRVCAPDLPGAEWIQQRRIRSRHDRGGG